MSRVDGIAVSVFFSSNVVDSRGFYSLSWWLWFGRTPLNVELFLSYDTVVVVL